jgi:hypothetical protein
VLVEKSAARIPRGVDVRRRRIGGEHLLIHTRPARADRALRSYELFPERAQVAISSISRLPTRSA